VSAGLPPDLPARPAGEAARLVALAQLRRAEEAAARLRAGEDSEALHDFRVALRRLRSLLRSHRAPLADPAAPGRLPRLQRRLRRIARATNEARDGEVHERWVRARSSDRAASASMRRAARWLAGWLERRVGAADRSTARALERFAACAPALTAELGSYRVTLGPAGGEEDPGYGRFAADVLRRDVRRLRRRLDAYGGEPGNEPAHRARLAAKRLRYDVEPLLDAVPAVRDVQTELKGLQDVLGELNDASGFLDLLREAHLTATREKALAVFAAARAGGSRSEVRRRHPGAGLPALIDDAVRRHAAASAALSAWIESGSAGRLETAIEKAIETLAGGFHLSPRASG
jgi:CHAD domain-containing protein